MNTQARHSVQDCLISSSEKVKGPTGDKSLIPISYAGDSGINKCFHKFLVNFATPSKRDKFSMSEESTNNKGIKFEPNVSKAVIDTAIDGIIVIDARGVIQMINPSITKLFGYEEEELIGKKINMLMPNPDRERHDQYIKNYRETGERKIIGIGREVVAQKKDGTTFPILLAISEANFGGQKYFAGILHDLSELKEIRKELKQSEMRMLHLSENLPVGAVYRIEDQLYLNLKIQQIIGYSDEEINSLQAWFKALMGTHWEEYYEMYLQDRRRNFDQVRTYRVNTKSGGIRWVDFAGYRDGKGEVWILHDVTQKVNIESELITLNEQLEKRVKEKTLALKENVMALEEANKKLVKREEELEQSLSLERELNELKSRFVSTASHEFRTPLSSILSSVDLIGMYSKEEQEEKRNKHINRIRKSVKTLTDILNDFLSLGKIEEGKVTPTIAEVNFNKSIESLKEEIQHLGSSDQEVIFRMNKDDIRMLTDKKILHTILTNLLGNALKYSEEDVYCEVVKGDDHTAITIIDRGIGIPKKDQKHLFSKFFRAENAEAIEGTGLGLSIVKKYIDILNGKISFESKEGEGTAFKLTIPDSHEENSHY